MMLFDQKQNPPMAIIRAAATPLMRKARALSHPALGADSQTTGPGGLMSERIRGARGSWRAALGLLAPWQTGREEVTALALRPQGSVAPEDSLRWESGASEIMRVGNGSQGAKGHDRSAHRLFSLLSLEKEEDGSRDGRVPAASCRGQGGMAPDKGWWQWKLETR